MTPANPYRAVAVAALVLAVALVGAGCQEEPAAPPTTAPAEVLGVDEILGAVGENVANMSSVKFTMVDEEESGAPFSGMVLQTMIAEVRTPNDYRMSLDLTSPTVGFLKVEIIKVGDDAVRRLSQDAPWTPMSPDEVLLDFQGLAAVFGDFPTTFRNATLAGRETLDGAPTYRIDGAIGSEDLTPLLIAANQGYELKVTLWINEDTLFPQQIEMVGQVYDQDAPDTKRLLTLEGINVPVDIEFPSTN